MLYDLYVCACDAHVMDFVYIVCVVRGMCHGRYVWSVMYVKCDVL